MLYMVISLKYKVARLEASRLAFGIEQLKRKRLFGGDDALRTVWRNQRFDRAVGVREPKHRSAGNSALARRAHRRRGS